MLLRYEIALRNLKNISKIVNLCSLIRRDSLVKKTYFIYCSRSSDFKNKLKTMEIKIRNRDFRILM